MSNEQFGGGTTAAHHHDCKGQQRVEQRQTTWNEFLQALNAPGDQDFDAFYWIYRLAMALLDAIIPCRNHYRKQMFDGLLSRFQPVVPFVGMTLVLCCGWSYFSVFRFTVVRTKWCGASTEELVLQSAEALCNWEKVHNFVVAFFVVNIIGHYLWCTFGSPGFVQAISPHNQKTSSEDNHSTSCQPSEIIYHPNPNPTYCDKCEFIRPARAHHCRICKKCIELYDHHCPWTNNCIGRNNYRSFVLLVFYILAGCIYGVFMLGRDFCSMMKQRLELFGWSIRGAEHDTGLLDLPLPWMLWSYYKKNGYIDTDVVLRAAFPLMFFVGIVMWWFLGYHMRIILSGLTTLEDMSTPQFQYANPYDCGPRENLHQVFGSSWFKLFVPLPHRRGLLDASKLKKEQ